MERLCSDEAFYHCSAGQRKVDLEDIKFYQDFANRCYEA